MSRAFDSLSIPPPKTKKSLTGSFSSLAAADKKDADSFALKS
jgi:hypothetical protein